MAVSVKGARGAVSRFRDHRIDRLVLSDARPACRVARADLRILFMGWEVDQPSLVRGRKATAADASGIGGGSRTNSDLPSASVQAS